MSSPIFGKPILNSPYDHPHRQWEQDGSTQPGIEILNSPNVQVKVKANGLASLQPNTVYNEEHFFERDAYFLGANAPYQALKTTLEAKISARVRKSLRSDKSLPFDKPSRS